MQVFIQDSLMIHPVQKYTIPSCEDFKLYDFKFSDFELSEDQTIQASLRMFLDCNLVTEYHIPYEVSSWSCVTLAQWWTITYSIFLFDYLVYLN